jgi:hypothetical protein
MYKILFNRDIGLNTHSFMLPEPVQDIAEYGAIATTGLTS